MASPTTPILTTFTGANEDPLSEGGRWSGPMQDGQGQLRRLTNQAVPSASGIAPHQSFRQNVLYAADQEAYGFWGVLPAAGQGFACWCRLTNPNGATTAQAVLGVYTEGTGFRLFEFTVGASFVQIGGTDATVATDNQGLWLDVTSGTANLYHWNGSAWVLKVTNATTITGAGYIGLELNGANMVATSFGGGNEGTIKPPALLRRSRRVAWA
jgi:hypothetical protein